MSLWARKIVLLLAFAVMPMQGVAATLAVLLCHGDAQAHATHAATTQDHGDPQHQHGDGTGDHENGTGVSSSYFHLCCNLSASAPPSITLAVELPDFPVRAFMSDALRDLFIPDRPQRPPLA